MKENLSEREMQVLKLVASGKSTKEIAAALNLSPRTIEVHRYNILKKTGSKNSITAVKKVLS